MRLEVALLSFVAASIGIAVAVGFGWALIDVTGGAEIPSVVVPWSRLAVTLVVAVAAGVVAAAWPAFRVSRCPCSSWRAGSADAQVLRLDRAAHDRSRCRDLTASARMWSVIVQPAVRR
ncbi:hypothetical protein GCM10029992_00330 [Glycomyces albus]